MVTISNHAMERYAERIADRESTIDIKTYVQKNKEKIESDINIMIEHSQFIYSGRVGNRDNTPVNVYLSGTWVLLLDLNKTKVITLYKVDFNVGEDFNKQFIQKILNRMDVHKAHLEERKKETSSERQSYQNIIDENNVQIAEYKNYIKQLERMNTDYQEIIKNIDVEYSAAELLIKRDVEDLVMRREF